MLKLYTRGLDFVLRHQRVTLATFLATMALTVVLYVEIPKGFFPAAGHRHHRLTSDAPQDISFAEMVRRQHLLTDIVATTRTCRAGRLRRRRPAAEQRLHDHRAQAARSAHVQRRSDHPASERQDRHGPRRDLVPAGLAGPECRRARRARSTSTRCRMRNLDELNEWAPKLLAKLQQLPQLRDVGSDQQTNSTMLSMTIDRDQAARFGIQPSLIDQTLDDAFGQRQVTQYFTQLNAYHVILEITPALQSDPQTLSKIYVKSPAHQP
jgi:HAE1 family hydrophobic/amphiphilic exporter-1